MRDRQDWRQDGGAPLRHALSVELAHRVKAVARVDALCAAVRAAQILSAKFQCWHAQILLLDDHEDRLELVIQLHVRVGGKGPNEAASSPCEWD